MGLYELQEQVREFDRRFGWAGDVPEHTLLHMQEELGEISRNILRKTGYRKETFDGEEVNDEISDLIYLTFKLGNLLGLDLDEGWNRLEERYEKK
ncbi:MAG: hypothetical protein GF416_05940 [Candidatus Altiarchaeales archaeon]|nr:hypothetical protein [Candidatus Altiarchaeales archaeon]MBD3416656.1 hypothetical protein [Candidatus Altiarchaeales archaeon]